MKTLLLLALFATAAAVAATNETYNVKVGWTDPPLWQQTNCLSAEPHSMSCWLIRWVENGKTNEFHAFAVKVSVETNRVHSR